MRKRGWNMLALWAGGANPMAYTNKVIALSPIAYWPLADASGGTATDESGNSRNGAYSNVTLGAAGIGDSRTATAFNGSTSYVNTYTASLAAAFNGAEGTLSGWFRVSASGVWTDATFRYMARLRADASNECSFYRDSTNNELRCDYKAGGVSKAVLSTALNGTTAWFHAAMTWSKSADQFMFFLNGTQVGATQTGLGVFAGSPVNGFTTIGAANTSLASLWTGYAAHVAVWSSAVAPATITALATV